MRSCSWNPHGSFEEKWVWVSRKISPQLQSRLITFGSLGSQCKEHFSQYSCRGIILAYGPADGNLFEKFSELFWRKLSLIIEKDLVKVKNLGISLFEIISAKTVSVGWILQVSILRWPGKRGTYFRMTIIMGTTVIRFLVFSIAFPGCLRNGSGMHPNLPFKKNSSNSERVVKIRLFNRLNSSDNFLSLFRLLRLTPEWCIPLEFREGPCSVTLCS